jgi:nitroreductase
LCCRAIYAASKIWQDFFTIIGRKTKYNMQKTQSYKISAKADPIIYQRISPRSFIDRDIRIGDLMILFEAARWAASSFNEQPWSFIYASGNNSDTYEKLISCLSEGNKKWASKAPVLMLTVVKTYFEKDSSKNKHAYHDLGLAMGNLSYQATRIGISIHQMAGFSAQMASDLFNLPEGYEPVTMVALGYSDEKKPDRSRKAIEEFVFEEAF